jgi:hypothetical protein
MVTRLLQDATELELQHPAPRTTQSGKASTPQSSKAAKWK